MDQDQDDTSTNASITTLQTTILNARETTFTPKEKYYYRTINRFFKKNSNKKNVVIMTRIVNGDKKLKISLRLLDWFVTKYAYMHKTSYKLHDSPDVVGGDSPTDIYNTGFDVHISYKSQLKSYKKKNFDPFRRNKKFYYKYGNNQKMLTTICQLNFFKWVFENKIIEYIEQHYKEISQSMIRITREEKLKKQKRKQIKMKRNKKIVKERKKKEKRRAIKRMKFNNSDDETEIFLDLN